VNHTADRVDVVVVGAGMAGATLSCALAAAGLDVSLVESGPAPKWNGDNYDLQVSAINLASQNILMALGIWSAIRQKRISPIEDIETWDEGSTGRIFFSAADAGLRQLGHIIENKAITATLHEKLKQQKHAEVHYGLSVTQCQSNDEEIVVTTHKGRVFRARLLVGADGALSQVRELAGIGLYQRPYRHAAIVGHVVTEKSHRQAAYQRFLSSGPLAFLPLADQRSSIVWSADTALAEELLQLSNDEFQRRLGNAFQQRLGHITSVGHRERFALVHRHVKRYVSHRIALVGDAAHTVHPLAGLGANQGLVDAATLAEVLIDSANRERDFGGQITLRRYERWRRGENQLVLNTLDGLYHLFGSGHPMVANIRGLGLNMTNRITPLKMMFLHRATGLSGDLPQMAKHSRS
jgi:2-octaprenylphenol hydroxylase